MAAGEGLGRLTAYAQQQVQVLSPPAADTVQMSAAVHAAAGLGAEVIKMTGSATAEEALAFLQGRDATVMALSAKVVEYGVQAGVLPAAEADRYRKMTPPQLLGHLRASAGAAVIQMTAAAGDGAAPPAPKAEPKKTPKRAPMANPSPVVCSARSWGASKWLPLLNKFASSSSATAHPVPTLASPKRYAAPRGSGVGSSSLTMTA